MLKQVRLITAQVLDGVMKAIIFIAQDWQSVDRRYQLHCMPKKLSK